MAEYKETYLPDIGDFHPDIWWSEDFTPEKRLACLQYVEDIMAKKQGRKARTVLIKDLGGDLGLYPGNDTEHLYISDELVKSYKDDELKEYFNPFQAFATVVHEGRHAFQDDCIKGLIKFDKTTTELWRKSFLYIAEDANEDKRYLKYYFKPTEEDANRCALNELKDIEGIFDGCEEFKKFIDYKEIYFSISEKEAKALIGDDFRDQIIQLIRDNYDKIMADTDKKANADAHCKERKLPAFLDFGEPIGETRKFSVPHLVMTGISVLLLIVMYLIARPHGFLRHVLWMTSSALAFLPMILLSWKKGLPKFLRNRFGGILMLAVYAVLLLLIQFIYKWLFVVYVIAGILFLLKTFNVISPNLLTIVREEADGTVTTEARVLGDDPDADIAAAERELKNEGYTIKK